jgi:hypothetical protein
MNKVYDQARAVPFRDRGSIKHGLSIHALGVGGIGGIPGHSSVW